jgi:hypothetical protein
MNFYNMSQRLGCGDIIYFPHWRDLDTRVKGKKLIVTYIINGDTSATIEASSVEPGGNGDKAIELNNYTKHWAMKQLRNDKSPWIKRT